ncbi:hypothetical protein [Rickettsia endosymbiont of Pantilius tunicatus]|uniref:hypothetical protein n=1 Tax=Rickettsia endosymbiont of Pantilius tunicatus TaxID=3066267 RepID=UPI0030E24FD6
MTKNTLTNLQLEPQLSKELTLIANLSHRDIQELVNEAIRLFVESESKKLANEAKRQSLLASKQKNLEEEWEANQDHKDWI